MLANATVAPRSLPPIAGRVLNFGRGGVYDGRYRLYTVSELPFFDLLPDVGGPHLAVLDGWQVSTERCYWSLTMPSDLFSGDSGEDTLNIRRSSRSLQHDAPHPLDGTKHPTYRDAMRAAYNAGVMAYMVYERHAARWGLPTTCQPKR